MSLLVTFLVLPWTKSAAEAIREKTDDVVDWEPRMKIRLPRYLNCSRKDLSNLFFLLVLCTTYCHHNNS